MKKIVVLIIIFFTSSLVMSQTVEKVENGLLIKVLAKPQKGFNYDYYILIPNSINRQKKHHLLVESNNTGFPSDSIKIHDKRSRFLIAMSSVGNYVSQKLKTPFLVPVFPRPMSDANTYTHALDRDAILKENTHYNRLDVQLVNMIKDAKKELSKHKINTHDKVFITGFSASASFMNRFSFLHPEIIKAMSIGGLNGILMLPLKKLKFKTLNYPLGINDFSNISRSEFDFDTFKKIPQHIYMGEKDNNDAVKFDDAYNDNERSIIHSTLSENMRMRWEKCQSIYVSHQINVIFKTYENIGHSTPFSVLDEIVAFFKLCDR